MRRLLNLPLVNKLANREGLWRRDRVVAHDYRGRAPSIASVIVPDFKPGEQEVVICSRLLAAYRLSKSCPLPTCDVWSEIRKSQGNFLDLLDRGDPAELAAYMCNMNRQDATIGTVQGEGEYRRITRDRAYRRFIALMTKDKLVSLAEALGVIPCENPEQGVYGESLRIDAAELVEGISRKLGIPVIPPPIDGGLLKIEAGPALYNERDLSAIFTAYTLSLYCPRSVCEIGAGSGRVAYWSHRLGIRCSILLDLPHINVVQGFYLLKALPDAAIRLHGEPINDGIAILPCQALEAVGKIDIVLNQDSFPEIERGAVVNYLEWIKRSASKFLSINHESKPSYSVGKTLSVPELAADVGGLKLKSRVPYWLRKGYVMELYEFE